MSEKVDKVPQEVENDRQNDNTATLLCAPQTIFGSSKKSY